MTKHAEVKQEHRREAKRFYDTVDFLEEDELAQFLADHDAEVERKAWNQALEAAADIADQEFVSYHSAAKVIRGLKVAELGGTNG